MNAIADNLFRADQILSTEWSLHPDIVSQIFSLWNHPNVDLFATRYKCLIFVSPTSDIRALDTEALPLRRPVCRCLSPLIQVHADWICFLILIAPYWQRQMWQMWFTDRLNLSQKTLVPLPRWDKMLKQPWSDLYRQNLKVPNLHAWRLFKCPWTTEVFLRRPPGGSWLLMLLLCYNSMLWSLWKKWCESQDLEPSIARVLQIAEFFQKATEQQMLDLSNALLFSI